jgi:TfoX/Sxy family transcriptional regulator of competence genes
VAYNTELAERLEELLNGRPGITSKKMFGGLAFLRDGKMFCGIAGDDLMLRLGPEGADEALSRRHVREMDFTGRPLTGYVYLAREAWTEPGALEPWIDRAERFVATLEATPKRKPRRSGVA